MTEETAREMARAEREDFAALLDGLSPAQWESPTLCERWRVRDVVAHVFSYEDLSGGQLVRRFVRGGLVGDRVNEIGVAEFANRSPEALRDMAQSHLDPRGLNRGFRRPNRVGRRHDPSTGHPPTAGDPTAYPRRAVDDGAELRALRSDDPR